MRQWYQDRKDISRGRESLFPSFAFCSILPMIFSASVEHCRKPWKYPPAHFCWRMYTCLVPDGPEPLCHFLPIPRFSYSHVSLIIHSDKSALLLSFVSFNCSRSCEHVSWNTNFYYVQKSLFYQSNHWHNWLDSAVFRAEFECHDKKGLWAWRRRDSAATNSGQPRWRSFCIARRYSRE